MTVTENIEIVMRCLFQVFAMRKQKLVLFAFEFLFFPDVADTAFARPEMCNAHANVRIDPTEQPLAKFTVKEPFQDFVGRIAWPQTIITMPDQNF